jgi:hypothetical protein
MIFFMAQPFSMGWIEVTGDIVLQELSVFTGSDTPVVPEPGSLPLLGIGLLGLVGFGRQRKR